MKFERIMASGIVVDGIDPGADERLTLNDLAHAMNVERWGGHHPRRITIAQHSLAMSRWYTHPVYALACLWHDAAEVFVADLPTTLKHQPEMAWYREVEKRCLASLVERFAPCLVGFDWAQLKALDRAALRVESEWFPHTPDRDAHLPFGAPTLGLEARHYLPTDNGAVWYAEHLCLYRLCRRFGEFRDPLAV